MDKWRVSLGFKVESWESMVGVLVLESSAQWRRVCEVGRLMGKVETERSPLTGAVKFRENPE